MAFLPSPAVRTSASSRLGNVTTRLEELAEQKVYSMQAKFAPSIGSVPYGFWQTDLTPVQQMKIDDCGTALLSCLSLNAVQLPTSSIAVIAPVLCCNSRVTGSFMLALLGQLVFAAATTGAQPAFVWTIIGSRLGPGYGPATDGSMLQFYQQVCLSAGPSFLQIW